MKLLTRERKRGALRWLLLGVLSTSGCNCLPSDLGCDLESLERPDAGPRKPWLCICEADEVLDGSVCFANDGGLRSCLCACGDDAAVPDLPDAGGRDPDRRDSGAEPDDAGMAPDDAGSDDAG